MRYLGRKTDILGRRVETSLARQQRDPNVGTKREWVIRNMKSGGKDQRAFSDTSFLDEIEKKEAEEKAKREAAQQARQSANAGQQRPPSVRTRTGKTGVIPKPEVAGVPVDASDSEISATPKRESQRNRKTTVMNKVSPSGRLQPIEADGNGQPKSPSGRNTRAVSRKTAVIKKSDLEKK